MGFDKIFSKKGKEEKTGVIFDVDGTLLDSMGIWKDVGARYVERLGKTPEDNLSEILFPMSVEEGAAYVKKQYDIPFSPDEIIEGVLEIVRDYYFEEAPLKNGARELLETFRQTGIPMVIATSSEREHIERAFARLGVDRYFQKIFTCSEVGAGKTNPLIYEEAAKELHMSPHEIWVFEDALYALRTAKKAGFHTVAVYDAASEKDQETLREEAEIYAISLERKETGI